MGWRGAAGFKMRGTGVGVGPEDGRWEIGEVRRDGYYGMEEHEQTDYESDDDSLISAMRNIGLQKGAGLIDPLARLKESDDEPSFGDDNLDVRRKAAARGARAPPTPNDSKSSLPRPPAAKKGLDLNVEKNLADLEDPRLMEHMRLARERLAEQDRGAQTLRPVGELGRDYTAARRALSETVQTLNRLKMSLEVAMENVTLNGSNLGKLVAGEKPHRYPQGDYSATLPFLQKKIVANATELSQIIAELEELEKSMTLVRRNYETVVDGYARHLASLSSAQKDASPSTTAVGNGK